MTDFPADLMAAPAYGDPDLRQTEQQELARQLLRSYFGRAFVWRLIEAAGLKRSVFAGEAPLTMSYLEGRRQFGQEIENEVLTIAPEAYNLMRREAIEREQRYAAAADTES